MTLRAYQRKQIEHRTNAAAFVYVAGVFHKSGPENRWLRDANLRKALKIVLRHGAAHLRPQAKELLSKLPTP